jgi:hypothetical protein
MKTQLHALFVGLATVALACADAASRQPRGYVSRAEFGDKWPLTVSDGVLACTNNAVTFTHGGRTYAVNGRARGSKKYPEIEPIWQTQPLDLKFDKLERLPEPERRRIFAESVACEDAASKALRVTER